MITIKYKLTGHNDEAIVMGLYFSSIKHPSITKVIATTDNS